MRPQNEPMKTAAVILAAGASTRFGSPKQLARIGGRTLVEHVVATARAAGLDPIVTVLPSGVDTPTGAVRVVNDDPAAGQSRSLRLGLAALEPDVGAAVVLLADQPTLSLETLQAVVTEPDAGLPIVAAGGGRTAGSARDDPARRLCAGGRRSPATRGCGASSPIGRSW